MNDTEDDEMSKTDTGSNLKVPCPPMTVVELEIGMIEVGPRTRSPNDKRAAALVESIDKQGLWTPVTVLQVDNDGQASYRLLDGLRRLTAFKKLGMQKISAFVMKGDALDREMWQIDENLSRRSLKIFEQAKHLKRRKEIYEAKGGRIPPTFDSGQNMGFAKDTEKKTGTPKRRLNELINLAEKIPDDVEKQIRGTAIEDNTEELKALAGVPADQQLKAVAAVKSGEFKSVRAALGVNAHPNTEKQFKALERDWRNADAGARERFLQSIGAKIDGKGPPAAAASTKVGVGATDEDPGEGAADKTPDQSDTPRPINKRTRFKGATADGRPPKAAASSG